MVTCIFKIPQESVDRTANEQYRVGAIQDSTSRYWAALMESVEGFPKGNSPSRSADSVETHAAIRESAIPERKTWDEEKKSELR